MASDSNHGGFGKVIGTALAGVLAGGGLWWLEQSKGPSTSRAEAPDERRIRNYKRACELLSLPYDRAFIREEMERKVRILIKRNHPDTANDEEHRAVLTEFSQNLNWARQLIIEERHWG